MGAPNFKALASLYVVAAAKVDVRGIIRQKKALESQLKRAEANLQKRVREELWCLKRLKLNKRQEIEDERRALTEQLYETFGATKIS